MAVEHATLREIPAPPNAPRLRSGDGAGIRYFQGPDGRVAGFVGDGHGSWTQVVAPRDPAAFAPGASRAPLMRLAPGVEAPMAEVEPPPGTPASTPEGEALHWFAGPGGSRLGFVREGEGWRPALREPSPAAVPPAPALPAPVGPPQSSATPTWMRVPALPSAGTVPSESEPATTAPVRAGGVRGWARTWWDEAGRNTEAKRARKRSRSARRRERPPAGGQSPDEPAGASGLRRRRRWASRGLTALAGLGVALVVLTLVSDLVTALHPPPQKVEQVVEKGGGGGLSSTDLAASSFAVQFAWAYLTYDQSDPQQHAAALAPFLGSSVSDTWDGTGAQQVATAEATSVRPEQRGTVEVDVAAYVASVTPGGAQQLRWLYLSVPVEVTGSRFAIAGLPATIPPPGAGTPPSSALSPTVSNQDTQLTQQLTGAMQTFFQAWASGNATQLAYLEAPAAAVHQLGPSQQSFVRLANFQVEQGSGGSRTSLAEVTWSDAVTGAEFTQPYTVDWTYSGSRWLISSVRPGTP